MQPPTNLWNKQTKKRDVLTEKKIAMFSDFGSYLMKLVQMMNQFFFSFSNLLGGNKV